ncbi:hypothetical protein M0R45_014171 [Rubus argutus]|uniref:Ribosomal protein L17 n=1 Tax=Rubus argutus TaxID=59490 RepID=A0AAW1XM53_RUBAR
MTKLRKLNGTTAHRMSMLRTMVSQSSRWIHKTASKLNTYIYELVMLHRSTAYIEFIDRENELRQSPPPRIPLDPWTRSKLCKQFAPPKEIRPKAQRFDMFEILFVIFLIEGI